MLRKIKINLLLLLFLFCSCIDRDNRNIYKEYSQYVNKSRFDLFSLMGSPLKITQTKDGKYEFYLYKYGLIYIDFYSSNDTIRGFKTY